MSAVVQRFPSVALEESECVGAAGALAEVAMHAPSPSSAYGDPGPHGSEGKGCKRYYLRSQVQL